jgi:hypothetical protein
MNRTLTAMAAAAERLANSRPWRDQPEPVNAWPLLNPWAVMTAVWFGWALAHIAAVLL